MNWSEELADQLGWHWENQLRPRLDGLTDDEHLWRPTPDAWTIHPPSHPASAEPDGSSTTGASSESGGPWTIDFDFPPPEPAPVTTIAWRLAHVIVGVFGERNARYFGGPAMDYGSYDYPPQADVALRRLDEGYAIWMAGIRGLGDADLDERCREDGFTDLSMAALVLHIHREVIHHGAEISLLRDLYPTRGGSGSGRQPQRQSQ